MTFRPPNVPGNPMLPHGMPQPMYAPMPPFAMGMRPGVPGQPMPPSGPGLIPMVPPGGKRSLNCMIVMWCALIRNPSPLLKIHSFLLHFQFDYQCLLQWEW